MSDQFRASDQPTADEKPEYTKPKIETLGDLRDLTEGASGVLADDGPGTGSQ